MLPANDYMSTSRYRFEIRTFNQIVKNNRWSLGNRDWNRFDFRYSL